MILFNFQVLPMPHYIACGEDTYTVGQTIPNRSNIGVFDLIFVKSGELKLAEEHEELRKWRVQAGQLLILRPDCHHYSFEPCGEETHFYWLHFHTEGNWNEIDSAIYQEPIIRDLAVHTERS